jgi:hypothetical protein
VEQTTALATFLLLHTNEHGIAAFEVVRDSWTCVYISQRARIILGGVRKIPRTPLTFRRYERRWNRAPCREGTVVSVLPGRRPGGSGELLARSRCRFASIGTSPGYLCVVARTEQSEVVLWREERSLRTRPRRDRQAAGIGAGDRRAMFRREGADARSRSVNIDVDARYSLENWLAAVSPGRSERGRPMPTLRYRRRQLGTTSSVGYASGGGYRGHSLHSERTAPGRQHRLAGHRGALRYYRAQRVGSRAGGAAPPAKSHRGNVATCSVAPSGGTDYSGLETALLYEPASEEAKVGGDFCDAFPISDREIARSSAM